MSDNTELCQWLRDNSSGIYRQAKTAAELIEDQDKKLASARSLYAKQLEEIKELQLKLSNSYFRAKDLKWCAEKGQTSAANNHLESIRKDSGQ